MAKQLNMKAALMTAHRILVEKIPTITEIVIHHRLDKKGVMSLEMIVYYSDKYDNITVIVTEEEGFEILISNAINRIDRKFKQEPTELYI